MLRFLRLLLFCLWAVWALAVSAAPSAPSAVGGDSAYRAKNYQAAVQAYEREVRAGSNADLYYNLGNAYYRLNQLPQAIKNYERALRLDPSHRDAAYNLELCQTKIVDKFDRPSEMFFITWIKKLVYGASANAWGIRGLWSVVLACLGWGLYVLAPRLWARKGGLVLAAVAIFALLFCNVAAYFCRQRFVLEHKVVIVRDVQLMDDNDRQVRDLHVGAAVRVLESSPDGTLHVELPDGKQGWLDGKSAEKIY